MTSETGRRVCIGLGVCAVALATAAVLPAAPAAAAPAAKATYLGVKLGMGAGLGAFTAPHLWDAVSNRHSRPPPDLR